MIKKNIRKSRYYAVPVERVWAAITDPEALSKWFMEADFESSVGYQFTFKDKPQGNWDGILKGEVLAADAPNLLEYTWKGDQMKHVTTVRWQLEPEGNGTKVILTHTGFQGLSDTIVGLFHQFGWNKFFNQLAEHLDKNI